MSAAPELADAVGRAERAARRTSVDASGITFMDSSGIALLARLATRTPGPLRIIDPPEVVRFLLDVTRIGDMVEIVQGADATPDGGPFAARRLRHERRRPPTARTGGWTVRSTRPFVTSGASAQLEA